jgi:hypothetical protein
MKRVFYVLICVVMFLSIALFQISCKDNKGDVSVIYDFNISETNRTLEVGQTFTLVASYGDSTLTFVSNDTEVATVSNDGTITALKKGTAYITVTSNETNVKRICEITVIEPSYTVSFVDGGNFSVFVGAYKNLSVKTLKDGVEYDGEVSWSVSGDGAELVQIDGRTATFLSMKEGTFEITVSAKKGGLAKLVINVVASV